MQRLGQWRGDRPVALKVLDGLEAVVYGSAGYRRVHNIDSIRWADDFIVTANSHITAI